MFTRVPCTSTRPHPAWLAPSCREWKAPEGPPARPLSLPAPALQFPASEFLSGTFGCPAVSELRTLWLCQNTCIPLGPPALTASPSGHPGEPCPPHPQCWGCSWPDPCWASTQLIPVTQSLVAEAPRAHKRAQRIPMKSESLATGAGWGVIHSDQSCGQSLAPGMTAHRHVWQMATHGE